MSREQDAIKPENKWLEALFKNSTEAIALFDRNHCVVDVNQCFIDLFQYRLDEIKGKDVDTVMNTGRAGTSNRDYTEAVLSGKKIVGETIRYNKEGLPVYVLVKGIPIVIDGQFAGGYAIYSDISERKRAEEDQKEIEAKYRSILASVEDGYYETDLAGNIAFCNDSAARMLGFTREEFSGMNYRQFCLNHEKVFRIFNQGFLSGQTECIVDMEMIGKDGSTVYGELSLSLVRDRQGAITGFRGVGRNVSERKRAEEALRKSEERYRQILASIEEGYYEIDLHGVHILINDSYARITGYSVEELTGSSYKILHSNPAEAFKAFHTVYRTGRPEKGYQWKLYRKDGGAIFVEVSISLVKDDLGAITGFRGIVRDVTERMELEKQLRYLSLHDQLTCIYNRTYYEAELQRLSGSRDYPITIISADVDGLKLINDSMGHDQGDQMLKGAAEAIKSSLRESDLVARVGGDEFAVILPRTDAGTGEAVVTRIRDNIARYNRHHAELPLGLSLGVATADSRETDLKDVFKQSDELMYRDKLHHSTAARNKVVQALLAALAERDFITEGHALRLKELCRKVGERANLSSRQISDLLLLSQVHDLGKVGIPDNILFKEGPLDAKEWEVMRLHPEKGYRIAVSSADLSGVADLILKHHERWDGSGYPLGLAGTEIPEECRILAIVDAYDAIISDRPYRKARSKSEAIAELKRCAGTQFDPEIVDIFVSVI